MAGGAIPHRPPQGAGWIRKQSLAPKIIRISQFFKINFFGLEQCVRRNVAYKWLDNKYIH